MFIYFNLGIFFGLMPNFSLSRLNEISYYLYYV